MNQYRYDPADKRELGINKVISKLKGFRVMYIIAVPVWAFWIIITASILYVYSTEDVMATDWAVGIIIISVLKNILKNARQFLSNVGGDFFEQLQADLNKGLPFLKNIIWRFQNDMLSVS